MPLSMDDAVSLIKKETKGYDVRGPVNYQGNFLFQVFTGAPNESGFDPYFMMNSDTGEVRDFSVLTDGNLTEIARLKFEKLT